jgi:hypothetical protein
VTGGALEIDGLVITNRKLAKYDAIYILREAAEALRAQGHWQAGAAPQPSQTQVACAADPIFWPAGPSRRGDAAARFLSPDRVD